MSSIREEQESEIRGARCFPGPLFPRGVTGVAGTWVDDPAAAITRQRRGEAMGGSTDRILVRRGYYPGFEALRAAVRPV